MGYAIIIPDADFSQNNIGTVTPSSVIELLSISIDGDNSVIGDTALYSAVYSPADTTQRAVRWSVESGGEYASINSSTGVLTILPGASANSVTIKVVSRDNPAIYSTKTITVTYKKVFDWADLLSMNQTEYRQSQRVEGIIDGWLYKFITANDNSKIGTPLSGIVPDPGGPLQFFKIPVSGCSSVKVPVFKTSSGYGYAFTNASDIVTGLYTNSAIDSGTYQDLSVPANSSYLYLPLSSSIYTALGTDVVVEVTSA